MKKKTGTCAGDQLILYQAIHKKFKEAMDTTNPNYNPEGSINEGMNE